MSGGSLCKIVEGLYGSMLVTLKWFREKQFLYCVCNVFVILK